MTSDSDDKAGHRIELRWAGLELTERQFEQYCEAWPHTAALVKRVPRDRSRWDEPANRFALPDAAGAAKDRA